MKRELRRRIALYGGASVIALGALGIPQFVKRLYGPVSIRVLDVKGAIDQESTRMLRDLIRVDTSVPPGIIRPAIDILARAFACEGIPYEIVGEDRDRPVLVARLAAEKHGDGLVLLNHLDVVPPGDLKLWAQPPFAAEMGTGLNSLYLYGRGVLDMKGQAVAGFYAMAALKRAGITPRRDILYVAETGEETFQPELGIGWLMTHRPDLLEGITDVFNEGGVNETIGSDIKRFGVEVLQKGTISLYVSGSSRAALDAFQKFLKSRNDEGTYRLDPAIKKFMGFIGPSRGDIWGRSMIEPEHALKAAHFRTYAPENYKAMVEDYFYWGPISAGTDGRFQIEVAYTLLPGSLVRERLRELEGWIQAQGLSSRPHFLTYDSVASPETGMAWDALNVVLELDPEKAEVGTYVLTGAYTNSCYVRAHGLRAYGISPFNVNINDASKIHHENERMILPYFVEGVGRMERILREFATRPGV